MSAGFQNILSRKEVKFSASINEFEFRFEWRINTANCKKFLFCQFVMKSEKVDI